MSDVTSAPATPKFVYKPVHPILRIFLLIIGTVSLGIGIVAIVIPGIPTTIFVLIAIACYARSSERMYLWMMRNKYIGEQYHNIREGRGIPMRVKVRSLLMAWLMIGLSTYFLDSLPLRILLISLGITMAVVMWKIKTYRPELNTVTSS